MTYLASRCSRFVVLCGALTMAVGLANCGGGSSGPRTGSGGSTTGAGGSTTTGAGGSVTGAGGSTTTGAGGTATNQLDCVNLKVDPAIGLLTDFSDWDGAAGKWGQPTNLRGSKFPYGDNVSSTAMANVEAGALLLTATVIPMRTDAGAFVNGGYAGGGISFDNCVNTTRYTGVRFLLGGTAAGCDVFFQIQTFSEQAVSNRGGCTSSCYGFPKIKVEIGATPVTVMFSQLENTGMPTTAAAIAAEMVGFQWQFQSAAGPDGGAQQECTGVAMTIDDITLIE